MGHLSDLLRRAARGIENGVENREATFSQNAAPLYSAKRRPCDCWIFGILKRMLNYWQFNRRNETEAVVAERCNSRISNNVLSVFRDCMSRFA
jgi:hypothetical protein